MLKYLCLALALLLSGCAFMRSDSEPLPEIDPSSVRLADDLVSPDSAPVWPEDLWWRKYGDKQLNNLIESALKDSPSIAVASQRAELARAGIARARASGLPLIEGTGQIEREKVSYKGFLGSFALDEPAQGFTGPWYTTGNLGISGGYELDIWGKNRARVQAAIGAHKAGLAELAAAELAVACAVAQAYWDMQTLFARRESLVKAQDMESLLLEAQKARHFRGLASNTDKELANARLASARQALDSVNGEIILLREALRAMIGPEAKPLEISPAPLPGVTGVRPGELGYELLARRPDLQAAHWYIESSLSEVDAAKAAFYPSFSISAFLGLDAIHLKDLFKFGSEQFNFIGGLTLPIFDSGRLNADLKTARAASDLNIASYNKAVLEAVREVAQAAALLNSLEKQSLGQDEVAAGLEYAVADAQAREKLGLADRTDVAGAMLPLLKARDRADELRGRLLDAEIALIKALGRAEDFKLKILRERAARLTRLEKRFGQNNRL